MRCCYFFRSFSSQRQFFPSILSIWLLLCYITFVCFVAVIPVNFFWFFLSFFLFHYGSLCVVFLFLRLNTHLLHSSYITEKLHFFVVCCSQFACSVHSCSFSSSLTVCSTFSIRKTAFRTVYSHSYESVDFETATKSDYAFKQKLFIRQYFHVAYFIGDQYEIPRDLFLFILWKYKKHWK